jgi:hypothetical protein
MTSDSTVLSSLRPFEFPVTYCKWYISFVPSRDILSTSSFSVLDVSHVPSLTMNLFSAAQIPYLSCRVIFMLIFVLSMIFVLVCHL